MVSFCDLPLSQVKEHIGKYGSYGIGLTKDWAKKRELSPVQYISVGSLYALSIKIVGNAINPNANKDPAKMTTEERAAMDVIRYSKNYEGELRRPGKKAISNYRYYDEREWRYVPVFRKAFPMIMHVDPAFTSRKKTALNKLASKQRLRFDPSDIKYIIVKAEKDISEFVDAIRTAKGSTYSHDEIERLTTRILTKEQIDNDF